MQLTFESLAELQDFVQWVQAARQAAPKATIVVQDLPVSAERAPDPEPIPEVPESTAVDAADKPVRKRRTKAEMEAARAAEAVNPTPADSAPESESNGAESNAEQPVAAAELSPQPSGPDIDEAEDVANFMRARLAERPEVSQVEHLNLARTFIGKYGMEKYNASFPLAGLTPNVMGYSPADCATHAAALDFLSLE